MSVRLREGAMGYNARNDEIRDNITRIQHDWAAGWAALATVRRFNAANGEAWFWPTFDQLRAA